MYAILPENSGIFHKKTIMRKKHTKFINMKSVSNIFLTEKTIFSFNSLYFQI